MIYVKFMKYKLQLLKKIVTYFYIWYFIIKGGNKYEMSKLWIRNKR